jgi:uncharacterized protein (UPF0335 family)
MNKILSDARKRAEEKEAERVRLLEEERKRKLAEEIQKVEKENKKTGYQSTWMNNLSDWFRKN